MTDNVKTEEPSEEVTIILTAKYEGKIDDRREQRIHAAFKRCGVSPRFDVDWTSEDETDHELEIFVGDGLERANRLAAELRACGMIVVMRAEPEETDG
jgi:hypothetical protein